MIKYVEKNRIFLRKILECIEKGDIEEILYLIALEKETIRGIKPQILEYITNNGCTYVGGSVSVNEYDGNTICNNILFDIERSFLSKMELDDLKTIVNEQLNSHENILYVPIKLWSNVFEEIVEVTNLLLCNIINKSLNTNLNWWADFFNLETHLKQKFVEESNLLILQIAKYEDKNKMENFGIENDIDAQLFSTFGYLSSTIEVLEIKKIYKFSIDCLHPPVLCVIYDLFKASNFGIEVYGRNFISEIEYKLQKDYLTKEINKYITCDT